MTKDFSSMIKFGILIVAIIVATVVLKVAFSFSAQSRAIELETNVENALEDTCVSERNRVDTVEALADSTKSYVKLEKDVNIEIAKARTAVEDTDFDAANTSLNTAIKLINEAYPDLKSSELYKDFNREMVICNRKVEESRKTYNKALAEYEKFLKGPFWGGILKTTSYERITFKKLSESLGDNQEMPEIDWSIE